MSEIKKVENLFRKESIRRQESSIDGEVWIGTPQKWRVIGSIIFLGIICVLLFALTATYAKQESVSGWLIPHGGIIRIPARSGGIITNLKIKEGDRIKKEQILGTISLSTHGTQGDVGVSLQAATNAEIDAIKGAGVASKSLLEEEKISLERQLVIFNKESQMLSDVRTNLRNREELIRSDLERTETLRARGYMAQSGLDTKKAELLAAQQAILQNEAALHSTERQIDDTEARIRAIPNRLREQYEQRSAQEASLKQKLTQVEAQASENIVAPIDGTVATIQSELGQALPTGGIIASITPGENNLEAELFVPTRAIGFVRKGQDVALHFQAFPYQRYGGGKGKIISISKTIISPSDVPALGISVQEPVFRIKVKLGSQAIRAYGESVPLQPGMLLNANIVLERRSLFRVLFDPILAVSDRN
jgi:membrane fusion protein